MNRNQVIQQYRQRIKDKNPDSKRVVLLSTDERNFLVQDFVQQLAQLDDPQAVAQLCQQEKELLEEGYGAGTNSTTNYLSKYRQAIALAVQEGKLLLTPNITQHFTGRRQATGEEFEATNHLAWSLMRYDNSVYLANRKATNVGNNERQDNPQPFNPDRFLAKATELLQSHEAETLAVGIAAVTGRRHTEVAVSGQFTLTRHSYVLTFDGQLKKDTPVAYTIATLIPAKDVMQAIERFRAMPEVQEMEGLTSEDKPVKRFRARVNTRVKQHFQKTDILPVLPGFQSVSVHRLRGAYARMIVHYWLPNQGANEQRFLQFYLGHVEPGEMRDAFNSGSTTHYFGYRLVDDDGKPISASGIKLMANPPLPNPTDLQFQQQQQANEQLETTDLEGSTTPDTEETSMTPTPATVETIAHDLEELPEKSQQPVRVEEVQTPTPTQRSTRTRATKPRLKDLAVNLNDLAAAAENLRLPLPKGKSYQALLQQLLHNLATAETDPVPEPQGQRSPIGAEFVQSLSGLTIEIASLRQQLQDVTEQLSQTQAERESLRLLGNEVASLRAQLNQAQADRDSLQTQVAHLLPLQAECDQLRTELGKAQDLLSQFRLLSMNAAAIQSDPIPAVPTPEIQTSAMESGDHPAKSSPAPFPQSAPSPAPAIDKPATDQSLQRQARARTAAGKLSPQERIIRAIGAIIHHNSHVTDPRDRWFVSREVIKRMSNTNSATYIKPLLADSPTLYLQLIEQFPDFKNFPTLQEAIDHHNQRMHLPNNQHNKGRDEEELQSIYESFDPTPTANS